MTIRNIESHQSQQRNMLIWLFLLVEACLRWFYFQWVKQSLCCLEIYTIYYSDESSSSFNLTGYLVFILPRPDNYFQTLKPLFPFKSEILKYKNRWIGSKKVFLFPMQQWKELRSPWVTIKKYILFKFAKCKSL